MTTPLGVPNLPTGALTVSTLGQSLQDQTVSAMRGRAGARVPSIFNASTGGDLLSDLTPFGIITRIWAQVNSLIAQADPVDIDGPEDIPALLLDFIEGLPVVGQFVQLLQAFTNQYDGEDEILLAIQELFGPIVELAGNIVELFTGAPGALDELKTWAEGLPLIGPIVSVLTGDADGPQDLAALGAWARSLLTGTSKIPAENLIGQISDAVFSVIPVAHINIASPNLLSQGEFFSLATVTPGNGWTWDDSENRTGRGGSAKVTANGTLRELFSNQTIKVAEGDKVTVSAWIKTSGYTGSGSPIVLSVVPFAGTTQQSTVTIASRAGSTSWVQMTGASVYVVPAGVTSIRVRLAVGATATAGTIWWDDISVTKSGLLGQSLVDSLVAAWNKLWDGAFGLTGTVGKTWEDLNTALANPLGKANTANTNHDTLLGNLLNLPATVIGSIVNVIVDGAASMGQFLTDLFDGLNGSTGSTNKTVSNVKNAAGTARSQANLGVTNAATAQGAAATADGKAQGAIDGIDQAMTGATGTGATAGTVKTRLQQLNSNLWGTNTLGTTIKDAATPAVAYLSQGWNNTSEDYTSLDARITTDAIRQAAASLSDQIAKIKTTTGGASFSGNSASVSFNQFTTISGAGFFPTTISGTANTLSVSNGNAAFAYPSVNPTIVRARYDTVQATSSYQKVGIVFAGMNSGKNYIFARMSSDMSSYIYAWFSGSTIEIGYNTGSGEIMLAQRVYSGSLYNFAYYTGGTYWLECGYGGSLGTYRVLSGDTPVLTANDVSNRLTTIGTSKYVGFGGTSGTAFNFKQAAPLAAFAFYDNTPPTTFGSGFRVSRTSTATVNLNSTGTGSGGTPAVLPNTVFSSATSTVDYSTAEYTWSAATNGVTIKVSGWYHVCVNARLSAITGNNYLFAVGVRKNANMVAMGADAGPGTYVASASTIVYCAKDDVVYPVYLNNYTSTVPLVGEANGSNTYFSVSFLNNATPVQPT